MIFEIYTQTEISVQPTAYSLFSRSLGQTAAKELAGRLPLAGEVAGCAALPGSPLGLS